MKKILVLIISIAVFISCSNDDEDSSGLKIRLSNVSQFDFQNIKVNTTSGEVSFENLKSGKKSDYKVFAAAYRYAFVELVINGKTYTLQPIDYVGETLLEPGNYTYQINANDSQNQYGKLTLSLIKD
ncbi:hypothetical protein [Flavobacterium marginilacus]|uniref:hypothetical protein n=1 Tax=Flavobacterium marginilacus TaxID=3003256 RepID=UPI00248E9D82|nr:hypothetical protein [Flavobacterium marginilacus]